MGGVPPPVMRIRFRVDIPILPRARAKPYTESGGNRKFSGETPAIRCARASLQGCKVFREAFAVGRKFMIIALIITIVGGTLAMSKPGDAQILTRVGKVAANKIGDAMPESSKMAGPVNALRTNDLLPVSERVKLRMRTDKSMEGANILVIVEGGEVKLRGEVKNASQRIRAVELAQSTSGVDKVTNELVEPGQ